MFIFSIWTESYLNYLFALLITSGVGALRFLEDPPQFFSSHVGMNLDFNCTTDDPNATVSLLHSSNFVAWTEKRVTPNKLALREQVFTLLNVALLDGGQYRCKATDQSSQTIQWPSSHGFLFVHAGVLTFYFLEWFQLSLVKSKTK